MSDPESPNPAPKKKLKLERKDSVRSKNFSDDKKEPSAYEQNAWTTFATCLAKKNIFKELMDNINSQLGTFGETCSIPLLREAWDTVRCGGYTYALEEWATEENMVKTLTNFQAQWQNDPCTQALVESHEVKAREERRRRRLKKYTNEDPTSAKSTWGLSMSVGISVVKYQVSWSLGFIVNNCGCNSWENSLDSYKRKPDLKKGELEDESQRHADVEFYCIDDTGKCYLPTANGECSVPGTHICKNTGVTWVWGKSSTLGLGTDLIKTLGLSALGGGVSIGLTYDYDLPEMNCRFFPGTSLGASTSLSWGNKLVSLGGSLSLTVRVACPTNAPCGPTEVRYCGTSLGVSFSTNANIAQLVLFIEDVVEDGFSKASEAIGGPKIDLDLTINLPLPDFLSLLTGGGPVKGTSPVACDVVAHSIGPEVYDAFNPNSEYPFGPRGKWECGARPTLLHAALRAPHKPIRPFDVFSWFIDRNYWYVDPPKPKKKLFVAAKPSAKQQEKYLRSEVFLVCTISFFALASQIKFWRKAPQNEPLLSNV